jgi:hypothetical protein
MRNYVQPGNSLAIAVPYAGGILSGQGVLVGALFGVADGAWALWFALPWAGEAALLAMPFCVLTASPAAARWLVARGLTATQEEIAIR